MKPNKIMILGASVGQLPLIHKAVELGLYVITVDNIPYNDGHQFSHQYVNCSTVEKERVLEFARDLKIDGISTFASDVATSTVGYVSDQLGLPGVSLRIAQIMANKANFRKFQHDTGLNSPKFVVGACIEDVEQELLELSPPVMFKPVDTSGSRGISRLDCYDKDRYRSAFDYARSFSRSNLVCVEEFVTGSDVSGDGFMVNGQLYAVVTQKYKRGYVPTGHSLPTQLSIQDQTRIFNEVTSTCRALGYLNGPLDFDVEVSPDRVVVIEISPRLGGNGIPKLIKRATGVDFIEATINYTLGRAVHIPDKWEFSNHCGSWVFGSEHEGQLVSMASIQDIQATVPEVFEYQFNYQIGENLPSFEHSGKSLGYALFDCPPHTSYSEVIERLRTAMQLHICHDGHQ